MTTVQVQCPALAAFASPCRTQAVNELAMQGIKKDFDYKRILKALKKGATQTASPACAQAREIVEIVTHLPGINAATDLLSLPWLFESRLQSGL